MSGPSADNPETEALLRSKMASEGEKSSSPQLVVDRPALTVNDRHQNFDYEALQSAGCVENLKNKVAESLTCSRQKLLTFVYGKLPILTWLIGYDVKNWLLGDLIAGVTVAIMHIPQGMGFALLANVPAICGIYMAFYQSLIYAFLGTSQHNSMGSFAVITLMTGKVVKQLATFPPVAAVAADAVSGNLTESLLVIAENATDSLDMVNMDGTYTPIQIATVVTFMVGIWHMLFGILQLGSLAVFLSDMLVSGFTTAAAVHVLTSQMKDMLGITVQGYSGPLKIIYIYIDIFRNLPYVNLATLLITIITLGALIINNEVLKPIISRYSKVPVPIELIAVIVGTASSYLADFTEVFDVKIIGTVPTGLPPPSTPPLELLGTVAVDSLVIAIVSYTVNFSLAKIFAAKHGYPVDATQELYATGVGNIFSSFFACPPMASALARALIQDAVGGVTQMASLIVCAILLLVLLFIGPVFEALPKAVLASIIVVALKGMFWQVKDMAAMWSVSRIEAITWLVTFFSVVVIDIDYGLLIGVIFSLLVLLTRNQRPATFRLGRVPNTDLYLDLANYPQAREVPTLRLFKILGAIHFANRENLRSLITAGTGLDPKALAKERAQMTEAEIDKENMVLRNLENGHTIENGANVVRYLVLDVSGVSHVDTSGGKFLNTLRAEYAKADITLCLSGLTEGALDMMEKSGCLKDFPSDLLFHSLHDAVVILSSS